MSLELQINEDIKQAMLAKDSVKLAALRAVKAEILLAKTAEKAVEINDGVVLKIIQKMLKQRKESSAIFAQNNRPELAQKELAEASYLEAFLPQQMSEDEIRVALKEIIAQVGATGPADMGKVMGVASKKLSGLADGRVISEMVKALLAK